MNEVKELTVSQEKARTACINAYNKALAKCENATWLVAETIYKTVNREDFKELFGTKKNYAVAINLSCATVTKMESAYKRKLILNDTYTATQIAEMGKVEDEDLTDFVASCEVSPEDSCKTIRQKADVYVADMVEEEEAKISTRAFIATMDKKDVIFTIYRFLNHR